MTLAIETIKADADRFYEAGMRSAKLAEQARDDFYRLRREYRKRIVARGGTEADADSAFTSFQVAKDCIETEQLHGRWSRDRLAASRAAYQQVMRLQGALSAFMREHGPWVPAQREGA